MLEPPVPRSLGARSLGDRSKRRVTNTNAAQMINKPHGPPVGNQAARAVASTNMPQEEAVGRTALDTRAHENQTQAVGGSTLAHMAKGDLKQKVTNASVTEAPLPRKAKERRARAGKAVARARAAKGSGIL